MAFRMEGRSYVDSGIFEFPILANFIEIVSMAIMLRIASLLFLLGTLSDRDRLFALSKLEESHYQKDKAAIELGLDTSTSTARWCSLVMARSRTTDLFLRGWSLYLKM